MKVVIAKGSSFFVVAVSADELIMDSGKKLPYPTWVGTIDAKTGKLKHWNPAGYVPRGYKAAALALLEQVREQLVAEGKLEGVVS